MVAKNDSAIEVTNENFNELINNSHKIVVVDFFAEWCMPCLIVSPIIEELANEIKDVKFIKINSDDNQDLSRKYNISTIPCLVIFKDGKEVDRIIGAQPKEKIEEKINGWLD